MHNRAKHHKMEQATPTFTCSISSNICSGGRLATAWVMASGAFLGATGFPWRGGYKITIEKDISIQALFQLAAHHKAYSVSIFTIKHTTVLQSALKGRVGQRLNEKTETPIWPLGRFCQHFLNLTKPFNITQYNTSQFCMNFNPFKSSSAWKMFTNTSKTLHL